MNKRMHALWVGLGLVILICVFALVAPRPGQARSSVRMVKAAAFADGYEQHNLVSDQAGHADQTDANLVNPWGLAITPTGPWWVADNGTGNSTLYRGDGTPVPNATTPLVVKIPSANGTEDGEPTGIVFNGTGAFPVTANGNT